MGRGWLLLAGLTLTLGTHPAPAPAQDGQALLDAKCAGCHEPGDGGLSRIKDQRKAPEAWDMTLVRMMQLHGVEMTGDERGALVRHLADTQGLAPAETEGFRYILEREPATFEEPPGEELATLCARCHSWARVALQRRTEDEWRKLSHFHLGQYPTTEYQALGRDRNWWEIASGEAPAELADMFPLQTPEWDGWKDRAPADLSGAWRYVGRDPGIGDYEGVAILERTGDGTYRVSVEHSYADGRTVSGEGDAIVYTGFEWRSTIQLGEDETRQVFALSEDGNQLSGRSFLAEADSIGTRITAVRMGDASRILMVSPRHLRAGESGEIAIHGSGLDGEVSLGDGVTIEEVVAGDPETVVVRASADADAADGRRTVSVGGTGGDDLFTVYQRIGYLTVEPGYNIARVGGAGGPLPGVPAQFEAVAWLEGPDGQAETDDDVLIGPMAANWTTGNFDEVAQQLDDAGFAGEIGPTGLFLPADAGLNPERPFQTNNAGNLKVVATVEDGGETVTAEGQLIVTVQRWNDPPIR